MPREGLPTKGWGGLAPRGQPSLDFLGLAAAKLKDNFCYDGQVMLVLAKEMAHVVINLGTDRKGPSQTDVHSASELPGERIL